MTPVLDYFELTERGRFAEWATQLRACAFAPYNQRVRELNHQIDAAAAAASPFDSNKPDYYALRALGVLFYAVRVLLGDDRTAWALACAREARSTLANFDYTLRIPDGSSRSLVAMELRAQHEYLADWRSD